MGKFSELTSAEVIEHFVRRAHVERSLAISAMSRQILESVKKIFSSKEAARTACCAQQ